jgi:hypothetical protein
MFINGGQVTELGGNSSLNVAAIGGSLTINGGGTFTLGPASTIGLNLTIQNLPAVVRAIRCAARWSSAT